MVLHQLSKTMLRATVADLRSKGKVAVLSAMPNEPHLSREQLHEAILERMNELGLLPSNTIEENQDEQGEDEGKIEPVGNPRTGKPASASRD